MMPEQPKFTRSSDARQQILISVRDILSIQVACSKCGTTLSLDTSRKRPSLLRETRCPECSQPLWKGGDDTRLPREVLDAIFSGKDRFKFVVRTREEVAQHVLPRTA